LALALAGSASGSRVVTNDLELGDNERIIVVSGPNQGGKTTFARMFGQLHYLGSLGLPVPGHSAQLLLPDHVFTHFERAELLGDLRGKLEDELVRVHQILAEATDRSVVVMNESFSSTSLADNRFISTRVVEKLTALGSRCVYVTFVDELSRLNEAVTSYVSEVVPEDPSTRTFKVVRRPADGRAYALTLARKYGVTYEQIRERVLVP
jgi:DNA mismatch repair protein MutS